MANKHMKRCPWLNLHESQYCKYCQSVFCLLCGRPLKTYGRANVKAAEQALCLKFTQCCLSSFFTPGGGRLIHLVRDGRRRPSAVTSWSAAEIFARRGGPMDYNASNSQFFELHQIYKKIIWLYRSYRTILTISLHVFWWVVLTLYHSPIYLFGIFSCAIRFRFI